MTAHLKLAKRVRVLRGCCQDTSPPPLAVPLRHCPGKETEAAVQKKYLGERGAKRSGKEEEGGREGGECENTQADANPGFHSHANTHKVSIVWGAQCGFQAQKLLYTRPEWSGNCLLTLKYARLNSTPSINPPKAFKCQKWTNVFASPSGWPDTEFTSFLFSLVVFCLAPASSVSPDLRITAHMSDLFRRFGLNNEWWSGTKQDFFPEITRNMLRKQRRWRVISLVVFYFTLLRLTVRENVHV